MVKNNRATAVQLYTATLQQARSVALYQFTKANFRIAKRHAGTVATLTQAHVHGNLMVQQMQVALLGGALRLRDLVITLGNGGASNIFVHHEPLALPQSARRVCAKHTEYSRTEAKAWGFPVSRSHLAYPCGEGRTA